MADWGAGLNGLAAGISNGIVLGKQIRGAMDDYSLQKVREQGIAEAQAAAAAAAPKLTDNGAEPQMSADPNLQPEPINTSLDALVNNARERQDNPQQAAQGMGIRTSPVQAPDAPDSMESGGMSVAPQSTRADGSTLDQAVAGKNLPNLDAAARAGGPPLSKPKRFSVDGQEFDDEKSARTYIDQHTPQADSFYKDTLVPKMKARLLEMGRDKEAAEWQDYADRDQTRENFKVWNKARRLADFGDHNGAAEELFKLHPHYADGYTLKSTEPTKGPDGSDGFTMTVADKDGKEQKIYQSSETITRMGLPLLHPVEGFLKEYEALNKVDQAKAKEAVDIRDDNRRATREQANIAQRDADAVARAKMVQKEVDARQDKRGAQQQDLEKLRQSGRLDLTDKKIQAEHQKIAEKAAQGGGGYRKGKSPDEWKADIVKAAQGSTAWLMAGDDPAKKDAVIADIWNRMPDSIRNGVGKPASEVAYARGLPGAQPAQPLIPASSPPGSLSMQPPAQPPAQRGAAPATLPAGMKWRYNPATGMTDPVPR